MRPNVLTSNIAVIFQAEIRQVLGVQEGVLDLPCQSQSSNPSQTSTSNPGNGH